ncbi:MAG: hypothetical protein ACPL8I_10795, partial [Chloroflexaceae bacterium]
MVRRMKAWFAMGIFVVILGLGFVVSGMYSFTIQAQNVDNTEFVIQQSTPIPPTAIPPTAIPPTATPGPAPTPTIPFLLR